MGIFPVVFSYFYPVILFLFFLSKLSTNDGELC